MVGGFNTNVRYRGRTYHVQTEDSGPNVAKIVTLLYEGGTILFSRKTAYGKEPEASNREVVRQLMEQQHCAMVEALKSGEFDAELGAVASGSPKAAASESRGSASDSVSPSSDREAPTPVRPPGPGPAAVGASPPARPESEPKLVSVEPRRHRKLPPLGAAAAAGKGLGRRAGDEPPARDFGHGVITQKPLDEVVLAQLAPK